MILKINEGLVKGFVKRLKPFVYGVSIANDYDRAMLFCRYQEFYESPFKNIRGKNFTLYEFMKTYCEKNDSLAFTYPKDWTGFNLPSDSLSKSVGLFYNGGHCNEYDLIMEKIRSFCSQDSLKIHGKTTKWYLIGYGKNDVKTLNHEMAHAYYYTNKEYKYNCDKLIQKIKKKDYLILQKELVKLGYRENKKIIDDEIQAFMSTGLYSTMKSENIIKHQKDFIENFKKFHNV
jgi:hypothetical protein